jgi:hypothetical protein
MSGQVPESEELELLLLHTGEQPPVKVVPAERWRSWMDATAHRNANRCLPLLMANQAGWVLLNPAPFEVRWGGGDSTGDMTVEYDAATDEEQRIAESHFGHGILTFVFQCFFRTPPGYNLLARGPANSAKDGIGALDGLIETDWTVVPFSMNWRFTRPGTVEFGLDEPFCQVVPQRRGELERFRPRSRSLDRDEDLSTRLRGWTGARVMVQMGKRMALEAGDPKWSRLWLPDYFKGRSPTGEVNQDHQTQLRLGGFT